ncbi:MAG: vWA domain-containing protein, partial [Ktedonobacteraceae bacterium]
DALYPLIQEEIRGLFTREFQEQLRGSLYHWIELATAREISRPLHQVSSLLPDTVDEEFYSDRVMFGSTPFRKALDLAGARMIDPRYRDHHKVLLVISDGVFDEDSSIMVVAEMLKKRGVRIISGMIHPQKFIQQMFPRGTERWPEGAQKMLAIASDSPEARKGGKKSVLETIKAPQKFFYHINNGKILEELLSILFVTYESPSNP